MFALNLTLLDPEGDYMNGLQIMVNGPLREDRVVNIVLPNAVGTIHKSITIKAGSKVEEVDGIEVVYIG